MSWLPAQIKDALHLQAGCMAAEAMPCMMQYSRCASPHMNLEELISRATSIPFPPCEILTLSLALQAHTVSHPVVLSGPEGKSQSQIIRSSVSALQCSGVQVAQCCYPEYPGGMLFKEEEGLQANGTHAKECCCCSYSPFSFRSPLPALTYATATAVFCKGDRDVSNSSMDPSQLATDSHP